VLYVLGYFRAFAHLIYIYIYAYVLVWVRVRCGLYEAGPDYMKYLTHELIRKQSGDAKRFAIIWAGKVDRQGMVGKVIVPLSYDWD